MASFCPKIWLFSKSVFPSLIRRHRIRVEANFGQAGYGYAVQKALWLHQGIKRQAEEAEPTPRQFATNVISFFVIAKYRVVTLSKPINVGSTIHLSNLSFN
jgi:hypothetical protein